MAAVETVGCLRNAMVNNGQSSVGCIFQCHCQRLFLFGGKAAQHPVGQIIVRIRLAAHTDLYPGEGLAAQLLNDGLDAIMAAGRTVRPDAKPSGFQRDIVKQDDDSLGWNVKVGAQLQYTAAWAIL